MPFKRNRASIGIASWLALALAAAACLACSAPKKAAEAAKPVESLPAPEPVLKTATVVMTTGEVRFSASGEWKEAEIGDELPVAASVKTGPASSCDLAFGNLGAVRIGADTTVDLRRIAISDSRRNAEIAVTAGNVACKVSKLLSKDSFEIRSQDAVCGVRGTEFLVRVVPGKPSVVAVQEGKVALLPPSFDSAKIEALASTPVGEAIAAAVIEQLSAQAPTIQAGEESVIQETAMVSADTTVSLVMESLATSMAAAEAVQPQAHEEPAPQAPAQPGQAPAAAQPPAVPSVPAAPPAIPQEVLAAIQKFSVAAPAAVAKPVAITAESKAVLKELPKPLPENVYPKQPESPASPETSQAPVPSPDAATTPVAAALETKPVEPAPVAPAPAAPAAVAAPAPQPATAKLPTIEDAVSLMAFDGEPLSSGLVGTENAIFAADSKSRLSGFDSQGKRLWTAATDNGDNTNSRPVAKGGKLYFAGDAKLAAFDAATGAKVFSLSLDAADSGLFGRRPLILGNRLYLSSDSGLEVFDASSGSRLPAIALPEGSDMTAASLGDDSRICLVTRSGSFCIVDTGSGKVSSIATKAVQPVACSPLVIGKHAYFADRKGLVSCVDIDSGSLRWTQQLEPGKSAGVYQDPVALGSAIYFFAKSSIYALSTADGKSLFPPIRNVSAAPCIAQGELWYGTTNGKILAAAADSGKVLATITAPSAIVGQPLLSRTKGGRGLILFPAQNGMVALDLDLLAKARQP